MSSPTKQVIDPLICSYSEQTEQRSRVPLSSSGSIMHIPQDKILSSTQNVAVMSGWTPLVSRTFNNEIGSLSSTPSSKMYASIYKSGSIGEGEFSGLNLTPFLNHNINMMQPLNSAVSGSANGNFTPYYDKSMHMADFFMDSPIQQTPGKVESMTPSKFDLSRDAPRLNPALSVKMPVSPARKSKRSITQLDTPNMHSSKKSGARSKTQFKVEFEYDSENDVENIRQTHKNLEDSHFVTPSKKKIHGKVLKESKQINVKTPMQNISSNKESFQTPAPKFPVSSPSTVIMSSAVKTPNSALHVIQSLPVHPKTVNSASPTPNKGPSLGTAPVMGVFSERKYVPSKTEESGVIQPKKPARRQGANSKFQIVFTDVHTLMNSKKKPAEINVRLERKKSRSKSKKKENNDGSGVSSSSTSFSEHKSGPASSFMPSMDIQHKQNAQLIQNPGIAQFGCGPRVAPPFSLSQDYNTSMVSQKELSMMHNSAANSSNPNMTTSDHASFEMNHGGLLLTPSGKFLLDSSFEKPSPSSSQHVVASRFSSMQEQIDNRMPPPNGFTLQQAAQAALKQNHEMNQNQAPIAHPSSLHPNTSLQVSNQHFLLPQQHPHQPNMAGINMLISTPQHQNVMCGNFGYFANEETSPLRKDSIKFLHQQIYQYQTGNASPDVKEMKEEESGQIEAAGTGSWKKPARGKRVTKRKPKKR